MRVLVVTAVAAERDAVCAAAESCDEATLPGGYPLRRMPGAPVAIEVLAAGVGPAAAAAGTATALTAAALGFPQPAESPQTPAWTQLERARALVGVHRPAEARPLLVAARKAYAELNMSPRVRQVDELLAQLR